MVYRRGSVHPMAHASAALLALTPVSHYTSLTPASVAFCPVGGAETIVQPPAAKAGPAVRTNAAPTAETTVAIGLRFTGSLRFVADNSQIQTDID